MQFKGNTTLGKIYKRNIRSLMLLLPHEELFPETKDQVVEHIGKVQTEITKYSNSTLDRSFEILHKVI